MSRLFKTAVSLLLCFMLTLSLIPVSADIVDAYMDVVVTPSVNTAAVGDTVDFTVTATGDGITALEFTLIMPEGLSYVPNSGTVPDGLREMLGWAATDWTESTMKWTGYNDIGAEFTKDTLIFSFSCVVEAAGTHEIIMKDLLPFDGEFMDVIPTLTVHSLTVDPIDVPPALPADLSVTVTPSVNTASIGDTVNFTVTATGHNLTGLEFTLAIPQGLSYVAGSGAVPGNLKNTLGWAGTDWTESTMKWTGYGSTANFEKDTVIFTFSCVAKTPGTYEITLKDLLPFDSKFEAVEPELTAASCKVLPSVAPTITLKYPTLTFEDVIVMNVYYVAQNLQDVVEMGLLTLPEKMTSFTIEDADTIVPGYTWSEADGFYFSSTEGIAAKNLGDTVHFAIYAKLADGSYSYTKAISYSPKTYAYNLLKSGSTEMKQMVAAMLNYGAAAQTYFNYNTDALVNATMTAEQKALVSAYNADMIANVVLPDEAKKGEMLGNGGYAKRYPTISFEGAFCINYYFAPKYAPAGDITMYYWNQADFDAAKALSKDNATKAITMTPCENGEYMAVVDGIAAKDLDSGIYVAFCYSDGTTDYCSGIIGYSIGAYCKNQASKTGTLADLAAGTAVYGYYAKQLFG